MHNNYNYLIYYLGTMLQAINKINNNIIKNIGNFIYGFAQHFFML